MWYAGSVGVCVGGLVGVFGGGAKCSNAGILGGGTR